ncbi:MAG: hypothetical protein A2145_04815 [candidate division Zixibacteria bacterium RBG_16_40_9]|nr:MAG: hypothetical protein A2145_04815 [candidate division Zixibacteria bacterium RBG_16_40_9]
MRNGSRTAKNDFFLVSQDLAKQLNQVTRLEVIIGFNEFCAPNLDEPLTKLLQQGRIKLLSLHL